MVTTWRYEACKMTAPEMVMPAHASRRFVRWYAAIPVPYNNSSDPSRVQMSFKQRWWAECSAWQMRYSTRPRGARLHFEGKTSRGQLNLVITQPPRLGRQGCGLTVREGLPLPRSPLTEAYRLDRTWTVRIIINLLRRLRGPTTCDGPAIRRERNQMLPQTCMLPFTSHMPTHPNNIGELGKTMRTNHPSPLVHARS